MTGEGEIVSVVIWTTTPWTLPANRASMLCMQMLNTHVSAM